MNLTLAPQRAEVRRAIRMRAPEGREGDATIRLRGAQLNGRGTPEGPVHRPEDGATGYPPYLRP